jgi:hypothetical protein
MSCIYKKKEKILMSKFIEEFYYGNLDPQARSTKENKTVQKQMEVLMLKLMMVSKASHSTWIVRAVEY